MLHRVAGHYNMAATRAHNFAETNIEMAAQDLRRDGRIGPPTLQLLRLLNVARIVCFSSSAAGCPDRLAQASEEGPLGRVIHIAGASPAIFSRRLVAPVPPPGLDKPLVGAEDFTPTPTPQLSKSEDSLHSYLRDAGIDSASDFATALPVYDPSAEGSGPTAGDRAWQVALSGYRVSLQDVTMRIMASDRDYAQPWYPANEFRINGEPGIPLRGALDLVVVPLQAGGNDIEMRPITTPVRYYSAIASMAMLITACLFSAVLAVRERRRSRHAGDSVVARSAPS